MPKVDGLSAKQAAFVREYLVDKNGTAAAIRAGYSARAAHQIASENLTKPTVKEAIQRAMDERAERVQVKADDVLRGIKEIADDKEAPEQARLKAFELLGKHLKLFTDKVEHSGALTLEQLVLSAQEGEGGA